MEKHLTFALVFALVVAHASAARNTPSGAGLGDQKNFVSYGGVGGASGIGSSGFPFGVVGGLAGLGGGLGGSVSGLGGLGGGVGGLGGVGGGVGAGVGGGVGGGTGVLPFP